PRSAAAASCFWAATTRSGRPGSLKRCMLRRPRACRWRCDRHARGGTVGADERTTARRRCRMSQAVWTGSISFGLVNIPVRLYPATEPKDVRFHLYDRQSGRRVRYERVTREYEPPAFTPESAVEIPEGSANEEPRSFAHPSAVDRPPATGDLPVDTADVIRGFQLPNRDVVPISDEELHGLVPERSRTIEVEEFVDLDEIDPVFFEKSYYVAPTRDTGGDKSYLLLLRAMQASGMAGIGRFVLRTRPHLVAIRPLQGALGLE